MTISTLTLDEAAALVPMAADRLAHWAELGYVPGAIHAGKRKHWKFNRDVFTAGLIPLQVMLADVERRGIIDGTRRNPATGLPFVACDESLLDAAKVEVAEARARGALVTLTDHATVEPILTVQEHLDRQAREARATVCPWWLAMLIAVLGGAVAALLEQCAVALTK